MAENPLTSIVLFFPSYLFDYVNKTRFFLQEWESALPNSPLCSCTQRAGPLAAVTKGYWEGIAVTQLCSEYVKSVWCGVYFVDYFLSLSDPPSDEIPALHPALWVGQSADTIKVCKEAVVRHTKRLH